MRVLITGAGGLVATAVARRFRDRDVVELRHGDLDITRAVDVSSVFDALRPDLVLNCAVLGVDACEHDPAAARAVNVEGVANLAAAAAKRGAELLHFSTNYVFDGIEERVYTTADSPRPLNVYGKTKLEGEVLAASRWEKTYIVRTSWVFGDGKANFLSSAPLRLAAGEAVTAIDDVWASTTYAEDLAERVATIVAGKHFGTYHVTNAGICSYHEFANEAARLTGADPALVQRVSQRDAYPAPRPRYTPMRCLLSESLGLAPLRDWREALAEYVRTLDR